MGRENPKKERCHLSRERKREVQRRPKHVRWGNRGGSVQVRQGLQVGGILESRNQM